MSKEKNEAMELFKKICAVSLVVLGFWGIYNGIHLGWSENGPPLIIFSILGILAGIGIMLPDQPTFRQGSDSEPSESVFKERTYTSPVYADDDEVDFIITQDKKDDLLDRIDHLLDEDDRILSTYSDSGRYYSVPDRDDLPEWYKLGVRSLRKDRDAIMADLSEEIRSKLGEDVLHGVNIQAI